MIKQRWFRNELVQYHCGGWVKMIIKDNASPKRLNLRGNDCKSWFCFVTLHQWWLTLCPQIREKVKHVPENKKKKYELCFGTWIYPCLLNFVVFLLNSCCLLSNCCPIQQRQLHRYQQQVSQVSRNGHSLRGSCSLRYKVFQSYQGNLPKSLSPERTQASKVKVEFCSSERLTRR